MVLLRHQIGRPTCIWPVAVFAVLAALPGAAFASRGGTPFNINVAPDQPVCIAPATGSSVRGPDVPLAAHVTDPEAGALQVTFYGRMQGGTPAPSFRIVTLPDTQYYSQSYPSIFSAQARWIVNNRAALNIAYVAHEGDIVNVASTTAQWNNANTALSILDTLPDLPYGLSVGNHDEDPNGAPGGTANFNAYFPYTRYTSRSWYGGHYGTKNDNHYVLFSASGMDFIAIHMAYDAWANSSVLSWAANLLQTYSNRRAIVVTHYFLNLGSPDPFGSQGAAIHSALKIYPNLFLVLCGHIDGEARRTDVYNGHTVYSLLADYQARSNGGDGWLRILEFVPASNQIRVKTYSPTLDAYETDAESQFTLTYAMQAVPFTQMATVSGAASGTDVTYVWPSLPIGRACEWYVTVSDGQSVVQGPVWTFTTVPARGDFDHDDDVDLTDFALFQLCFNGPNRSPGPNCLVSADLDDDTDVDLADFSVFQACFNGPNRVPACIP